MLFAPIALCAQIIPRDELANDKKNAQRFGPCSLGKKAMYLGGFYFNNTHYIPINKVERVFKRLAVTKGFYEGKAYATLSYLVVLYDGGKEKAVRFQHEESLDEMLARIKKATKIPVGKV